MIASAAEAFEVLRDATVALSVAIAIVLIVRPIVRRRCGPRVAYALWWSLPASLVALAIPARIVEIAPQWVEVPQTAPVASAPILPAPVDFTWIWPVLWAIGAALAAAYQWRSQRRFVRSLGALRAEAGGVWRAQSREGLPALIGAFKPRIVLPVDFESRYDERERRLMLAHERAHLRHGDPLANLAALVLRVVFWFNPLVHLAASRFRADQELACDERVVEAAPHARRAYGEAMLKTLEATQPLPLGCHWRHAHPLKERLMQLNAPFPRRFVRALGFVFALALTAGTAAAVWSAKPPVLVSSVDASSASAPQATIVNSPSGDVRAEITTRIDDGAPRTVVIYAAFGDPIVFYHLEDNERFDVEAKIRDAGQARYDIAAKVERDGKLIASPRLLTERDKAAVVRIGEETADKRFKGIQFDVVLRPIEARDRVASLAPLATPQRRLSPLPSLEDAASTAGVRFDHIVEKDGIIVARPSVWVPFGQPANIALDNAVRVVSVAQAPRGNVSDVTSEFYVYSQGQWVRDQPHRDGGAMRMDARIDGTPSFERRMSNGYRVTVMQRKADRRSNQLAPEAPSHDAASALSPLAPLAPPAPLAPLAPPSVPAAPAPAPVVPPEPPAPPLAPVDASDQ
jgi:beta-lactamase regulating signal transducer with metallopeptidase domain